VNARATELLAEILAEMTRPPTFADRKTLEAYAAAVARAEDARSRIDTDGAIVADAKGQPVPHPALAVEKAALAEMRADAQRVSRIIRS
jgi:hypothetical protein